MRDFTLLIGDVRETLCQVPDGSVQTCVTSPPYWALRDYGVAGQIGLEPTPEEYVATLVEVFREVWRVLRPDGTLWLNLGDSYVSTSTYNAPQSMHTAAGWKQSGEGPNAHCSASPRLRHGKDCDPKRGLAVNYQPFRHGDSGLKAKDLVGIPWRVALALQADGWWLRSDIIWHKPNPIPESVTDRPTKAHEYLFLLAKSERYYFDLEAIAEEAVQSVKGDRASFKRDHSKRAEALVPGGRNGTHRDDRPPTTYDGPTRNCRDVWTIATQPYPGAHFAVFPPEIPRRAILAGSSPMACPVCGAPWKRITRSDKVGPVWNQQGPRTGEHLRGDLAEGRGKFAIRYETATVTLGWQPTCSCEGNDGSGKCLVLDPFTGSGTTAQVALQHRRRFVGCELNPAYADLIRDRLDGLQLMIG